MIRLLAICACLSGIAACATTATPTATTALPATKPAQAVIIEESEAPADPEKLETEATLDMVSAPAVEPTETTVVSVQDEQRICRRERRTGTNRAVRVCRTRAEISRIEEQSKETFRDLHDSQTRSNGALTRP